ncbi:hypothetical protein C3L33_10184, partial [Rhododendron williamsianum]
MGSLHDQDLQKPLLQSEETPPPRPPPPTSLLDQSSDDRREVSDELEMVLASADLPFRQRIRPAIRIELKLLWQLAAPAVFVYIVNYVMSMSTRIFSGHLGNLELAAASLVVVSIVSFITSAVSATIVIVFRDVISYAFTEGEAVANAVSDLCPLLAITLLLNGIQPVLSGELL